MTTHDDLDSAKGIVVSLIISIVFWAIFASVARAQVQGYSMPLGDGWYRHSWSNGMSGYSMPMGDGWSRHSFSDGTTGYTMPLFTQPTWSAPCPANSATWPCGGSSPGWLSPDY